MSEKPEESQQGGYMPLKEVLQEKELLEILGINQSNLRNLIDNKDFPCIRLARSKRVYLEGFVLEWLKKNIFPQKEKRALPFYQ